MHIFPFVRSNQARSRRFSIKLTARGITLTSREAGTRFFYFRVRVKFRMINQTESKMSIDKITGKKKEERKIITSILFQRNSINESNRILVLLRDNTRLTSPFFPVPVTTLVRRVDNI